MIGLKRTDRLECGVSLIEVLVAMLVSTIVLAALLGYLGLLLRAGTRSELNWRESLSRYNQSHFLRVRPEEGSSQWLCPEGGVRLLRQFRVGPRPDDAWEVLSAD